MDVPTKLLDGGSEVSVSFSWISKSAFSHCGTFLSESRLKTWLTVAGKTSSLMGLPFFCSIFKMVNFSHRPYKSKIGYTWCGRPDAKSSNVFWPMVIDRFPEYEKLSVITVSFWIEFSSSPYFVCVLLPLMLVKSCVTIQQGLFNSIADEGKVKLVGVTPITPNKIVPFHLVFIWSIRIWKRENK